MNTTVNKLKRIVNKLQEIIDEAECRETDEINTSCNTYGLYNFIALGNDGFLNLDADIDDLIDAPEFDDDME